MACLIQLKKFLWDILLIIFGILFVTIIPIFLLISLPFCVYRFLINKVISPCFRADVGKPVTSMGTLTATEFLCNKNQPTRCAIVVNFVIQGSVSLEDITKIVDTNWIRTRLPNGELQYPEFQQYIESWMGYMFWKQDKTFSLKNHIKLHVLNDDTNCEIFASNLMEDLLNNPFPSKRSPWEIHVIENYKDEELSNTNEKLTMAVFRLHHSLADGYSVMYTLVEGLVGTSLHEIQVASPSSSTVPKVVAKTSFSAKNILQLCKFPFVFLHEAGFYVSIFLRRRTPWHVEDKDKHWRQMYARSRLIPIQTLKDIKNKLNVSFTATLFSCVAGAIAKNLNAKSGIHSKYDTENMVLGFNVPLPGHPRKLRNHVTGATLDLCTKGDIHPFERLAVTEKRLHAAKYSVLPLMFLNLLKVLTCHLAPITKLILNNTMVPTGISNFPGPGIKLIWQGKQIVGTDFVSGAHPGVAGVGFMVLSYDNNIRIVVAAESAVMTRDEQKQLVESICEEINNLHDLIEMRED